MLSPTARKQATNIVQEGSVLCATVHLNNVRSEVAFEVDRPRVEKYTHNLLTALTALPIIVSAPGEAVAVAAQDDRVAISALDVDGLLRLLARN